MNAAFLLVTGAMLVGQGDKKAPLPPPAAAPVVASTCCEDPCGCEKFGHRLRNRLGGLFNRNNCDSCQPTSCHDHHHRTPLFNRGGGDNCCKPKFWNWQPGCREKHCGHANTCTDSCGHGSFKLLSNLRGRFSRNDCCDGGCGTVTTTTPPVKAGEKIDPPKKMPETPKKTTTEVRIETPAVPIVAPNAIQPLPTPPAVEVTPVPVPRVEGDRRDPF